MTYDNLCLGCIVIILSISVSLVTHSFVIGACNEKGYYEFISDQVIKCKVIDKSDLIQRSL